MNIRQIKETSLYIEDLEAAFDFYHSKLGLPLISRAEERHIFFRAGTSVLLCFISDATSKETRLPPHFGGGNQHLAFEVSPQEYDSWKKKVRDQSIEIIHEETWTRGLRSFYFKDPEENLLEIVEEGMWD